jgi:hypothetical protein
VGVVASTPYVPSIAVDAVITALIGFLQPFVGSTQIVRGQVNLVSPPPGAFVKVTEINRVLLETPWVAGSKANAQINITGPMRLEVQVDFYGLTAGDQAAAVQAVYRTSYSVSQFPAGIAPLYCTDAHQSPLTTGEEQYEARWTLTASLQYDPVVYIPLQFATALKVNILEDIL